MDDLKEALEILTTQHRSIMGHMSIQDQRVMELQKALTKKASNNTSGQT